MGSVKLYILIYYYQHSLYVLFIIACQQCILYLMPVSINLGKWRSFNYCTFNIIYVYILLLYYAYI